MNDREPHMTDRECHLSDRELHVSHVSARKDGPTDRECPAHDRGWCLTDRHGTENIM